MERVDGMLQFYGFADHIEPGKTVRQVVEDLARQPGVRFVAQFTGAYLVFAAAEHETLEQAQAAIYERAVAYRDENTHTVDGYDEFKRVMDETPGFAWSHWCGNQECELAIKDETKATIRLIPLPDATGTRPGAEPGQCIRCADPSDQRVYFAKAY